MFFDKKKSKSAKIEVVVQEGLKVIGHIANRSHIYDCGWRTVMATDGYTSCVTSWLLYSARSTYLGGNLQFYEIFVDPIGHSNELLYTETVMTFVSNKYLLLYYF